MGGTIQWETLGFVAWVLHASGGSSEILAEILKTTEWTGAGLQRRDLGRLCATGIPD